MTEYPSRALELNCHTPMSLTHEQLDTSIKNSPEISIIQVGDRRV